MNRILKTKINKYNTRISDKMKQVYNTKKTISPLTFANYYAYSNRQYDNINEAVTKYLYDNYKQIYFDERWRQIIHAKRINRRLRNLNFRKEILTPNVDEYLRGIIQDVVNATTNGKRERYLQLRLIELRNKQNIRAFLDEDEIQDIIQEAESYPNARDMIIDRLNDYSEDGQTIAVDTKSGGTRHYDIDYYADMVIRTAMREIQTAATLDAASEVGADLVEVSVHNTVCRICIEFEGKIYSIDGKNPMFPPLDDQPPYHPNCLHSITVVFESVLYDRGIQQYIDFAQGKSDIHPTARGWIPIAERDIK